MAAPSKHYKQNPFSASHCKAMPHIKGGAASRQNSSPPKPTKLTQQHPAIGTVQ
jgi:hypothetical protein